MDQAKLVEDLEAGYDSSRDVGDMRLGEARNADYNLVK
jgi:hypothetical protein